MKKLKKIAVGACLVFTCGILVSFIQGEPPRLAWFSRTMSCALYEDVKIKVGIISNGAALEIRIDDDRFPDYGYQIEMNDRTVYKYESYFYDNECGLEIRCFDEFDVGEYSFTLFNDWGEVKARTSLSVL